MKQNLLVIAGLSLLMMAGCVSNKKFETTVAEVTTRVDGIQGSVEDHGQRLEALSKRDNELATQIVDVDAAAARAQRTGDEAMVKAGEAEKAARGKVIWQVTMTNRDLRFPSDGTDLPPQDVVVLDELIAKLKSFDRMVFVEIQGHTDSSGSEVYNKAVGLKRAESVRNYLHGHGIPLNLMSVISYGEERPIADNASRDGRAMNRRVEVLVLE